SMKTWITSLLFCGLFLPLVAQDLIVTQEDEEIIVKVLEVKRNTVEYFLFENQEGTPLSKKKADIYMIIYEDGMRQFFSDPRNPQDILGEEFTAEQASSLYQQGIEDAQIYYNKNGLLWAGLGATVYFPMLGVATGGLMVAVVALTEPNINLHELPNQDLARNPHYLEGYQKQVQKHRLKKTLTGVGIGAGLQLLFIMIVVSTW
ncbi:MAG: hypothetical protein AAFN10_13115, partial [Bacteroidota bacterium]